MNETTDRHRLDWGRIVQLFVPLISLILLIIATAISEKAIRGTSDFLTIGNILNLFRQLSPVGIVALGMTFAIISSGIDLSVGSIVAMSGGMGIWLMNIAIKANAVISEMNEARQFHSDLPYASITEWLAKHFVQMGWAGNELRGVWIAVLTTIAIGTLAGAVNGLLIAKGKLAPFIATLGGLAAYRSIALAMADGGSFNSASRTMFGRLGSGGVTIPFIDVRPGQHAVLPFPILVFAALAVSMSVLLNKTKFGRYLIAVGNNERAAVYSAINVGWVKFRTYALVGFTAGVGALVLASRLNSVPSSQAGQFYELDAIAAVVIGGTRMSGGSGTIFGTVIGVLILSVIGNMLSFLNVSPYLQGLVKGVIIIVAVLVQRIGRRST